MKTAAAALAEAGAARLVLRGRVEVLVPARAPVASVAHLRQLAAAGALATKALKKRDRSLLVDDLRESLLDLLGPATAPAPGATNAPVELQVLDAVKASLHPSMGLSFVPEAVARLSHLGLPTVHAALKALANSRKLELQPESGKDLTPEQLALCPPGPHDTRFSWARLLEAPLR